jgi:hypothetical protein
MRSVTLLGAVLVPVVVVVSSALATVPAGLDITCDLDRKIGKVAAATATEVTFRLWDAASGGTQCGTGQTVPMAELVTLKEKRDRIDGQKSTTFWRMEAVLPSATLCSGDSWLEVAIGTQTLGCDFSRPNATSTTRRKLQAVPFASTTNAATSIKFPNYSMALGEVVLTQPGDAFFMINAGGGAHWAFGYFEGGSPPVILHQSGSFSTVMDTPDKFNLYSSGSSMAIQNLFEPDTPQVSVGTFNY